MPTLPSTTRKKKRQCGQGIISSLTTQTDQRRGAKQRSQKKECVLSISTEQTMPRLDICRQTADENLRKLIKILHNLLLNNRNRQRSNHMSVLWISLCKSLLWDFFFFWMAPKLINVIFKWLTLLINNQHGTKLTFLFKYKIEFCNPVKKII